MHTTAEPAELVRRQAAGTVQLVGFRLGQQNYALRIERIREIVIPAGIASLPEVPACVEGVSNLRGTIIPIVNLRVLFGLERRTPDADTRTIVVHVGARIIGCMVDAVSRVMRIAAEGIQPAHEAMLAGGPGFIEGFARVDDELFVILDADRLLDPARLDEVQRAAASAPPDRPAILGTT